MGRGVSTPRGRNPVRNCKVDKNEVGAYNLSKLLPDLQPHQSLHTWDDSGRL